MPIRQPILKMLWMYYGLLAVVWVTSAMHIPDGYLSPITSLIMFLMVLPFWIIAVRKIRQTITARSIPLIAFMAAFSFVIMMFNIPLPGGTTGHALGASLAAIILGPEGAVLAVSIALIIQALFFGDGGILAIGANSFNIAVVASYVSYAIYWGCSRNASLQSVRRPVGAGIGGWVGATIAAFFTGIEFGIQPLLFKSADGSPLYAPYPLSISIPAMVIPHMLVASVVEGGLTALVVIYLQRTNPAFLEGGTKTAGITEPGNVARLRWLWILLVILIAASPLGLLAPGTAWGEWGIDQLSERGLQVIPAGLEKLSNLWGAPLAGYQLEFLGNTNLGYVLSAALGIVIVAIVAWLFSMLATSGRKLEK